MKDDGPELSDQEKQAIAAIRRELDREFGDEFETSSVHPERSGRRKTGRPTGLAVGLGIMAVVALAAGAVVASRVLAPGSRTDLRQNPVTANAGPQSGPGPAPLIESGSDADPGSARVAGSPAASGTRRDLKAARASRRVVYRSKLPCPPPTRIGASSRNANVSLASTSAAAVTRSNPRPSTVMALANPVLEPRHVEAP